jgi:hypothetical protein
VVIDGQEQAARQAQEIQEIQETQVAQEFQAPEILFENRYEVTAAVLKKLIKPSFKTSPVKFWIEWAWRIVTAIIVVWVVYRSVTGEMSAGNIVFTGILIGIMIFSQTMSWRLAQRQIAKFKRDWGTDSWVRVLRFSEDRIEYDDKAVTAFFPYNQIRYIDETDEYINLWLENNHLVVDKSAFTVGNGCQFGAFVRGKAAEIRPLLSAAQQNLADLLNSAFSVILLLFCIVMIIRGGAILISRSNESDAERVERVLEHVEQQLSDSWNEELRFVGGVTIDGGFVAFCVDGNDGFYVSLLRQSGAELLYSYGHSYSVTWIDEFNKRNGTLFESEGVSFSGGEQTVIYGIADMRCWERSSLREGYTWRVFEYGSGEFVVYHRVV